MFNEGLHYCCDQHTNMMTQRAAFAATHIYYDANLNSPFCTPIQTQHYMISRKPTKPHIMFQNSPNLNQCHPTAPNLTMHYWKLSSNLMQPHAHLSSFYPPWYLFILQTSFQSVSPFHFLILSILLNSLLALSRVDRWADDNYIMITFSNQFYMD